MASKKETPKSSSPSSPSSSKSAKKASPKKSPITPQAMAQLLKGEITWAQLQGVSMQQAYAIAELGYRLFTQGKYKEAQKIFSGLAVLSPRDGYFHSVLGSIFARQKQADQALKSYSKAIELRFLQPQVFVNRAELLLSKGSFDKALQDLKTAMELNPPKKDPAIGRAHALALATKSLIEEVLKTKKPAQAAKRPSP